jgi:hypothetical protein
MEQKDTQSGNIDAPLEDYLAQAAQNLEAATPSAPDRRYLAERARLRAADLGRGVHGRGHPVLQALGNLAVILAIIAALIVVLVPYVRQSALNSGEERLLPMFTPAWASTDGSVIEFSIPYASRDDLPDWQSPVHPRNTIQGAVDAWLAQHADLQSELPGLPLANVSMSSIRMEDPAPVARVQVSVALTDSALVNDLADFIASRTGYAAPVVDTRTVYYSSEYPDLVGAGIKVHIDDRTFDFPNDFTPDEAQSVARMLRQRTYYSGHGGYEIGTRFGDCAVFKVEISPTGDLVITTIAEELDAEPEVLDALRHSSAMFVPDPEDNLHPWRDPVLELMQECQIVVYSNRVFSGQASGEFSVEFSRLLTWLVPEDKWQQLQERQAELIEDSGETTAELTAEDYRKIEEYAREFERELTPDKLAELGKTAEELAMEKFEDLRKIVKELDIRLNSSEYNSFSELTTDERQQAKALTEQLRNVTKQWYAEHAAQVYETSPGAEMNREVLTVGDVPVRFRVWIKCNDPALVDDLKQQLEAVDGLIRPLEFKQFTATNTIGEPPEPIYMQSDLAAE